jgi:signal-transduction protein with cAMP-binding, CBS, and nucleotidyltransferase domain
MSVGRICCRKTHLAELDESLQQAARHMREDNVGALVVLDGDRKAIGIITDRDLATRAVADGLDPAETRVADIMTTHPRTIEDWTPIADAIEAMTKLGVRRMPVVDQNERVLGVLSMDDLLASLSGGLGQLAGLVSMSKPGHTDLVRVGDESA